MRRGRRRDIVRVRSMRAADVPAVFAIERAVFRREAWSRGAFAYVRQVFAAARPARGQLWVATNRDGQLLGYTGVELSALGGEADIVNLAVDPGHRRRGIGRRLVAAVASYCRSRRVALVWLRVRASNRRARAFYRRCGFQTVGRFENYYSSPREDAVLMALTAGVGPTPLRPGRDPSTR